jgi:hypothetical protein
MLQGACPECGSAMEDGVIPDMAHTQVVQLGWQAGPPEDAKFLGMKAGLKVNVKELLKITARRCTKCGFLKLYAKPKSE